MFIDFMKDSYTRFRQQHEPSNSTLQWMGVIGVIGFPTFYLVRLTGLLPERYDDFWLRVLATTLCLLLAARSVWPRRFERYYHAFAYLTVFYCLSFFMSYILLPNRAAPNTIINMLVGAAMLALLTDWRNALVMLVTGHFIAICGYCFATPSPSLPAEFFLWWIPLGALLIAGGSAFKQGERRAAAARQTMLAAYAGSVAHEIRTPLLRMRHVFESLARQQPVGSPHNPEDFSRLVNEGWEASARGLQAIALTLAQVSPREPPAATHYLSALRCVEKAVSEYAYENDAERARISVVDRRDFFVRGDETLLMLVLFNLIRNALYHMPLRPEARITISVESTSGGNRIVVHDTGPGIRPEALSKIFDAFETSGKAGGTGLGLAFCDRTLRSFGGHIHCHSTFGAFTEFTLALPTVPRSEIDRWRRDVTESATVALRGRSVLVVDDQPVGRAIASARLRRLGAQVCEVPDGSEVLDALRMNDCALVLMSIAMPIADGDPASWRLRQSEADSTRKVPVLAHSALTLSASALQARLCGMDGFLPKPCSDIEFAQAIVSVLGSADAELASKPKAFAGCRALIADDAAYARKVVRAMLTEMGVQVSEATHGQQVLDAIALAPCPDFIVLDMQMPGLDGLATTRALRAMPGPVADVPVVILTANDLDLDRLAARSAGASAFLVKPVDSWILRQTLHAVRHAASVTD